MKREQWSLNEFGWRSENLTRFEVLDQDGKQVCEIKASRAGTVPERAHLIAAAPELLDALKLFKRHIGGDASLDLQTVLHAVDAAIEKAEGK